MANEISLNVVMQIVNGSYRDMFSPGQISISQAAIGRGGYVQLIGTSETWVNFGDVVTNGYCILQNLDATHYVTYGPEIGSVMVTFGKLNPGEIAVLRIAPTVIMWAKADTAAVKLDVRLYED